MKVIYKTFLILMFSFLLQFSCYGRILLNIKMVYKQGIDKGLTIVSELQSAEEFYGDEYALLEMKGGIKLKIGAKYADDATTVGPSSLVELNGEISNQFGDELKTFGGKESSIYLGKEMTLLHDGQDQLIEIKIIPSNR